MEMYDSYLPKITRTPSMDTDVGVSISDSDEYDTDLEDAKVLKKGMTLLCIIPDNYVQYQTEVASLWR